MSRQCERWQLLDSAQGGQYCGACGKGNPMLITDAAVEAGAKALWAKNHDMPWTAAAEGFKKPYLRDARDVLEASATHIAAKTLREASDAYPLETAFGGAEHAVLWLKERANHIGAEA